MFSPIVAGVIITTNMVSSATITSDTKDCEVFYPSSYWVIFTTNTVD